MTVAYYIASFTDKNGKRFYGVIQWNKVKPRSLSASLAPYEDASRVGYPIWTVLGGKSRIAVDALKAKLAAKAKKLGLILVDEHETRFAPKAE